MVDITITLSDELSARLDMLAERAGVPRDELVRQWIAEFVAQHDDKFETAVTYVLKKNAELYRRLARHV
jgi:predicted transcriptional regulator